MSAMTWKKWRVGFWITIGLALASACAGLVAGMPWQAFVAVLGANLVGHVTAYLMKSPLEDVVDSDSATQSTPTVNKN